MMVAGLLVIILFVIGALVYMALNAFSKPSIAEIMRITFAMAFLAFCISESARSCSFGTGGGAGSATHR